MSNQPLGIDQCNCFTVRKASRRITSFYDAFLEPTGLRITQFLTLAAISGLGSASVNVLAERLDVERSAMGKMVSILECDGLVKIEKSPLDGRSRLIELTDAGQRLRAEAVPLWQEAQRQFEQLNGSSNVAVLRDALKGVATGDVQLDPVNE